MKSNHTKAINKREITTRAAFLLSSIFSIFAICAIVFAIVGFLLYNAIPAFRQIGFFNILFGSEWFPRHSTDPQFGILPFILGSLYTTILAVLMGVPLGLFTAIFLFKFCHKKLAGIIRQMINLLACLPSVVFGMFGLLFVVPFVRRISPTGIGEGIFSAGLILSIMILPTIVNLSLNALHSASKATFDGALALGASKEQAVFKVVLPAAKSGVFASIVLALGRAIGEAMAVSMVIGLNDNIPTSLFLPSNTMASALAIRVANESNETILSVLFALALVLFLFVLSFSIIFALIRDYKGKGKDKNKRVSKAKRAAKFRLPNLKIGYSKLTNKILRFVSYAAAALSIFALLGIVAGIMVEGLPYVNFNFIFGRYTTRTPTLSTALVGTISVVSVGLPISVLVGGACAIFIAEYAQKYRITRYIKIVIETLAGIPSIVYGMFGYAVFVLAFGLGLSLLSGGLTLSIMLMPIVVRTVEESLLSVPLSLREGAMALGASRARTIFKIVIPSALSGIVTSIILALSRAVAETSMLILTIG
ncbi:MAG: phosphate ABC transporter permease subunit PstC, partial [Firmicutes bacterium]|nr:phosphate ABC transporter permease subunit PstC [Bacillota bacterium]